MAICSGKLTSTFEGTDIYQGFISCSDTSVRHVHVIRRSLDFPGLPKVRRFAHSALLLSCGPMDSSSITNYFIVEYMRGEGGTGAVHWRSVSPATISSPTITEFGESGFQWKKQEYGQPYMGGIYNVEGVVAEMARVMRIRDVPYDLTDFNCHCAQEQVRRNMGLEVQNPYSKPFGDEKTTIDEIIVMIQAGSIHI